jgi:hypothetical protein
MPLSPGAASAAWRLASPRPLPGTGDKTASDFDKRGGRGRWSLALDRAKQEQLRVARAPRPHEENTTSNLHPPDRKSQIDAECVGVAVTLVRPDAALFTPSLIPTFAAHADPLSDFLALASRRLTGGRRGTLASMLRSLFVP